MELLHQRMLPAGRSPVRTVQERSPEVCDRQIPSIGDQSDSVSSLALRHTKAILHMLTPGGVSSMFTTDSEAC